MSTLPYHHGSVRQKTLDVARQMLESSPAHEISMREVARSAGISHAAPYKHFTERSDFLAALAARCMTEFVGGQVEAAQQAHDSRDRLIRLGIAYVDYGHHHSNAFALIFDPAVSPAGHPPPELATLVEQHTELLGEAVHDAAKAHLFPSDTPSADIATALWAQVHGLTQLVILGHVERSRVSDILGATIALTRTR